MVTSFLARAGHGAGVSAVELAHGYVDPLQAPGTLAFLRRFVRDTSATGPIDVGAIRSPTLVIMPQADRIVSPVVGTRLAAAIPGARYVPIADAGHMVQLEAPDRVAELIDGFLGGPSA